MPGSDFDGPMGDGFPEFDKRPITREVGLQNLLEEVMRPLSDQEKEGLALDAEFDDLIKRACELNQGHALSFKEILEGHLADHHFKSHEELAQMRKDEDMDVIMDRLSSEVSAFDLKVKDYHRRKYVDLPVDESVLEKEPATDYEKGLSTEERIARHARLASGEGLKDGKHEGKLRIAQLVPSHWVRRLARVLEYGAGKYAPNNWKGVDPVEYLDAGYRHALDVFEGYQESDDPMCCDAESQLNHIYQAAWNMLAAGYILEKRLGTHTR